MAAEAGNRKRLTIIAVLLALMCLTLTMRAELWPAAAQVDYSIFRHNSARHASLECSSCHARTENSATPRWPGHKACTDCHLAQFVTASVPMCLICHTDVKSGNPGLKNFPANFNEPFNVKFDHAQHMNGGARPDAGCSACHRPSGRRAAALTIPVNLSAHNVCYTCHTAGSRSTSGRDLSSCGVCHSARSYSRTSTAGRAFRFAFTHAKHGRAQRLDCADCHRVTAGAVQSRQVSSPVAAQHFPSRVVGCASCHNGRRSFGAGLAFGDCKRCHSGQTFRMPL